MNEFLVIVKDIWFTILKYDYGICNLLKFCCENYVVRWNSIMSQMPTIKHKQIAELS